MFDTNIIGNLYINTIETCQFEESAELQEIVEKIDSILYGNITLESEKVKYLDDLIGESQYTSERQGFINGFKYAVQMMKEVYQG